MFNNILIVGSSGSIGKALVHQAVKRYPEARISALSRTVVTGLAKEVHCYQICDEEASIADTAARIPKDLDLVIVATGLLHNDQVQPEKTLRDLSFDQLHQVFHVNTFFPAMITKHIIPRMARDKLTVFSALSARVGSISDNRLGGWYAYRASKAALNMILKNTAIESSRKNKQAIVVGLHPGTVDSSLSKPFQNNVAAEKIFTPAYSARKLFEVLDQLKPADTGKCFAWDGKEIEP